ncbi:MAG: YeeE/YedE family protein [Bacteriovoracaceae bacterium]|nr:YeeE/YedE family protein [Bacteriovoracaceae bacterium]
MRGIISFICGTIFSIGLGLSGMMNPAKVMNFLDITGDWDPSLAFVMVGAISIYMIAYPLILRRKVPLFDNHFHKVKTTKVDKRLLLGQVLFGVGWGLTGICPGPGIANLATLAPSALMFVGFMGVGMTFVKGHELRKKVCEV